MKEAIDPAELGAGLDHSGGAPAQGHLSIPPAFDVARYTHHRRSQHAARARGDDPGELLPGIHRIASLAKRWLLGSLRRRSR